MINITDRSSCCGCTACASICAHDAITMRPDVMGFMYPVVDADKCVDCGLCDKVCQFHEDYKRYGNFDAPFVYGVRHKNEKELAKSQSGAASWAIMETFLTQPGVVYGVAFDTVTHIVHKRATDIDQCQKFRGSKYVQSDLTNIFNSVKNDLQTEERVLFVGTGCQVSGLKSYLPESLKDNLLTVDIVCHAAPSPAFWKSYVEYIQGKRSSVTKASFRNKKFGWHSHVETFSFTGNQKEVKKTVFQQFYYSHRIIRPSCAKCHYTNLKRVSDITIGDYWGWEKHVKQWHDNKGVSLMLVNSPKGAAFFKELKERVDYIESDTNKCLQPQLKGPIEPNDKESREVEAIFAKKGYAGVARKYGYLGWRHQVLRVKAVFNIFMKNIGIKK